MLDVLVKRLFLVPMMYLSNLDVVASLCLPEKSVLQKLEEREQDQQLLKAKTRDEIQAATVAKMMNVTGGKEDVCLSLLKSNGFDLKTSIEAYYLR